MANIRVRCLRTVRKLFTQEHQNFTYLAISTAPNCGMPQPRCTMPLGMNNKATDQLSILRANDHFRDWHTLEDERICALCNRKFTGRDVVISTTGDEVELRCPTSNCRSGVHQWVYPGNRLLSEKNYQGWWQALGSNDDPNRAEGAASPQPI
jgi:hypothetical protein